MARSVPFNGQNIIIPGAYSNIVSGVKNGFVNLPYGGVLLIDTGSGAGYGSGPGIAGTIKKNKDAVQTFTSLVDFQNAVGGGIWYTLASALFFPNGVNSPGASYLEYVRACATIPAEMTLNFTGVSGGGGTLGIQCRDEGIVGNGILGDETLATSLVTITAAGTGGSTITITANGSNVGSYLTVSGNTPAIICTNLIAAINANSLGYTVSQQSSTSFLIIAPPNSGAAANSYTCVGTITGGGGATVTTVSPFAGGVNGTKITRGYGVKMVAGVIDSTKFALSFLAGTFLGYDTLISNGDPIGGISEASTNPVQVILTPEFSNLNDLQSYLTTDPTFNNFFYLNTFTINGTGAVNGTDLTNFTSPVLAVGGSETFSMGNLNTALDYLMNSQTSFIMLDRWGANALDSFNLTISAWNNLEAKFNKEVYVAGGKTEDNFATGAPSSSIDAAITYNSQSVSLVHSGVEQPIINGGLKQYDSIYHACLMLGRESGLEPQNPLTAKQFDIAGVIHQLSVPQMNQAISYGVLVTVYDEDYDPARFVVLKGNNTLQNNTNIINTDSTTASKQLRRIIRQLNKEIVVNAKRTFFGSENGLNRNTITISDITSFVQSYLSTKIAKPTQGQDNLILMFQNINVVIQGDAYYVTYEFEPNFEINFLLFTGVLIDPNS